MKKLALYLLLLLPFFVKAQTEIGMRFDHQLSWAQIKEKARSENKYIFVDVFATWCGPCKLMDRKVYTNDTVAALMNDKFISLKLQLDSAKADDDYVKSWRKDAGDFQALYKFAGYPSFVFFTPDGKMILQDIGYKTPVEFTAMANQSLDPQRLKYFAMLEAYKNGQKNYTSLGGLALFTRDVVQDRKLAKEMGQDYKTNYLDHLQAADALVKSKEFIIEYSYLISIKDSLFVLCYNDPAKADQLADQKGWAARQVAGAICREELDPQLIKDGKALYQDPDFKRLFAAVETKYPKADLKRSLLNYQAAYHRKQNQWLSYAKTKDEQIKMYPPADAFGVYVEINVYGAWDLFLHCNDHTVLRTYGLKWIDMALKTGAKENEAEYLDTKANILYKLGEKKVAIALEKQATDKTPGDKDIYANYQKMLRSEKTWTNEN
ncbi:DUF255 domain-containing protein [Mucilaginibacter sp. BJC16-A38]|uniref:thioredoxin family protein n=1 Tax=Mucilaginibacter phenanthrenivorans TaxID=1234842 RepID=UPI002157CDB8|nr:DUF255 domain-containing protein [Mucilaginibacter phenanthrenivorans]MCR8556931.1 DUF255 domain-containing protein [Mucilaginibacter phenanthrenivorans]